MTFQSFTDMAQALPAKDKRNAKHYVVFESSELATEWEELFETVSKHTAWKPCQMYKYKPTPEDEVYDGCFEAEFFNDEGTEKHLEMMMTEGLGFTSEDCEQFSGEGRCLVFSIDGGPKERGNSLPSETKFALYCQKRFGGELQRGEGRENLDDDKLEVTYSCEARGIGPQPRDMCDPDDWS